MSDVGRWAVDSAVDAVTPESPFTIRAVPLDDFTAVDEPGAEPLVGADRDSAVIAEDSDVMVYGDGGAGKTTLTDDLAFHLGAGDDWLGLPIRRPARVLLVENEGGRAQFRVKLKRKQRAWTGSPLADRVRVIEEPWAELSLQQEPHRVALAALIREQQLDVVILGPLTCIGMDEAGTLQEVRAFTALLADVRRRCGRIVTFIIVHHQNRAGTVSGAWEGAVATLLHVQAQGHGHTRLHVEKARASSVHHKTTMQLAWTDGDGFTLVEDKPKLDDEAIADAIIAAIRANQGTAWTKVEEAIKGIGNGRIRAVRDGLLRAGQLVNLAKDETGELTALDHVPERVPARLYTADDPTVAHLRQDSGAGPAQAAPAWAADEQLRLRRAPSPVGAHGVGAASAPPSGTATADESEDAG